MDINTYDLINRFNSSIEQLSNSQYYDVDKYLKSLIYQTNKLNYFYNNLVKKDGNIDTIYQSKTTVENHQLVYINLGRGFPKELYDGHWCYIYKRLGYKSVVIPTTSPKKSNRLRIYQKPIKFVSNYFTIDAILNLNEMKCVDNMRIDQRKDFCEVVTSRQTIESYVKEFIL